MQPMVVPDQCFELRREMGKKGDFVAWRRFVKGFSIRPHARMIESVVWAWVVVA